MSPAYGTTAGDRRATERGVVVSSTGRGGRGSPTDMQGAVDRTPTSFYCAPTARGPVRRDRERSRAQGGSSIAIGGAREHPSLRRGDDGVSVGDTRVRGRPWRCHGAGPGRGNGGGACGQAHPDRKHAGPHGPAGPDGTPP